MFVRNNDDDGVGVGVGVGIGGNSRSEVGTAINPFSQLVRVDEHDSPSMISSHQSPSSIDPMLPSADDKVQVGGVGVGQPSAIISARNHAFQSLDLRISGHTKSNNKVINKISNNDNGDDDSSPSLDYSITTSSTANNIYNDFNTNNKMKAYETKLHDSNRGQKSTATDTESLLASWRRDRQQWNKGQQQQHAEAGMNSLSMLSRISSDTTAFRNISLEVAPGNTTTTSITATTTNNNHNKNNSNTNKAARHFLFDVDESIITSHPTPSMSSDESISFLGGIMQDGSIKSFAATILHNPPQKGDGLIG